MYVDKSDIKYYCFANSLTVAVDAISIQGVSGWTFADIGAHVVDARAWTLTSVGPGHTFVDI